MNKEELAKKFLEVIDYMLMHGEMLKGMQYLQNAPAYIDSHPDILKRFNEVFVRATELESMQNSGTVNGKFSAGFIVPENIDKIVKFQKLKGYVKEFDLKKLVDIGCYTGWVGKALSEEGVAVHGIDVHPVVIQLAAFYASGSLATFEYLPAPKVGTKYPKHFDGAVLFDVLEHVFDPELVLRSTKRAVKEGGWIFINLPHPEGEHNTKKVYEFNEHEHLYVFSEKEVKKLMVNEKEVDIETITNEDGQINWFIKFKV